MLSQGEKEFVPLKPLCEAIGVDFEGQRQRVERDVILSLATFKVKATGRDGKRYEMISLPIKYIFGWLFTIDTDRVKEEARESVIRYKIECYDVLYNYLQNQRYTCAKSRN